MNKKQSVVFQCLSGPFQNLRLKRVKRLRQVKESKPSVPDSGFTPLYLTLQKSGVHPFGKQVVNIWKRSIIHPFSDIFRKENPTFSRCFRVGKLEYSFHYPAVFLHSELYENDCFLKGTVNRRENSLYSVVYWCFLSNKTLFSQTFSVEDNAFSSIF